MRNIPVVARVAAWVANHQRHGGPDPGAISLQGREIRARTRTRTEGSRCRLREVAQKPDFGTLPISIDESALQEVCERWGVTELDLFGSVLRDDFRPDSDIDVLVAFADDRRPTLFTLVQMEDELRQLFGRTVDLVVRGSVERSENYIRREHILRHRHRLYVAR